MPSLLSLHCHALVGQTVAGGQQTAMDLQHSPFDHLELPVCIVTTKPVKIHDKNNINYKGWSSIETLHTWYATARERKPRSANLSITA